jgi:hypothetical protein
MAKATGILKIEGTLENMTFYKSADGHMVRTKGGVSKKRIMNDPAFVRTRENGAEFGHSANAAKMLRTALGPMAFKAKDRLLFSRLLKVMSQLKNRDTISARGERNVAEGLVDVTAQQLLRGFDFNSKAGLKTVPLAPIMVDTATGDITTADFNPVEQIRYPAGATHFSMQSAFLNLDFNAGVANVCFSPATSFPIVQGIASPVLTPSAVPEGTGTQMFFLLIEFFQEINSVQYSLNNGSYNVLNLLEVV